jgi:TolB-like protein
MFSAPRWSVAEMDLELQRAIRASLAPRYDVGDVIGVGGMATVFRAQDTELGRSVAIKVLRPELAAGLAATRFEREILLTQRLLHPNVVPILDSGQSAGLPHYVMPLVEESLRARLKREAQLSIEDSIDIALEVARALSAAHRLGIIHRDIKPSNVFVTASNRVLVADFGVARLVDAAGEDRLTESGVSVGTPGYMSPEQASSEPTLDPRTDLYSLACVLYEMLAGEPPFTGRTTQAIYAKQVALPPPHVTTIRDSVPVAVDDVIRKSLARVPADRFRDVDEFIGALGEARTDPRRRATTAASFTAGWRAWAGAGLGGIAVTWFGWSLIGPGTTAVDDMRLALLPFDQQVEVGDQVPGGVIRDAFARWEDLTLVDELRLAEELDARPENPLSQGAATRMALDQGARWLVRGSVGTLGDSIRIQASLIDAMTGQTSAEHSLRWPRGSIPADSAVARLVDHLLFLGTPPSPDDGRLVTASLAAARAFLGGKSAFVSWNLAGADSAFALASGHDPSLAEAQLWRGVARWWMGRPVADWSVEIQQASAGSGRLSPRDQGVLSAMRSLADSNLPAACGGWRELTQELAGDFTSWYGLARCLQFDPEVVSDSRSPSGWSFRTSYHEAQEAYQTAFRLQPSILSGSQDSDALIRLLGLGDNMRRGIGPPPEELEFAGTLAWAGDSLVVIPYPMLEGARRLTADPAAVAEATRHQRERFRDIGATWVRAAPQDPDARRMLAHGLAMLGDVGALDTLRAARQLARGPAERNALVVAEIWMQLALSIPTDTIGLRRVKALADSLLIPRPDPIGDPWSIAALAALTGRAGLAQELALDPATQTRLLDPSTVALGTTAPALLALSAIGGPRDSLIALETRLGQIVEREIPQALRDRSIAQWLARSATLAFPQHRFEAFATFAVEGDYLWDIQLATLRGDTATALALLDDLERLRADVLPSTVTIDAVYPEADVMWQMGDAERAIRWLDPVLEALPRASPRALSTPERSASLIRAVDLRARLAQAVGDERAAVSWARVVSILWADADPELRPTIYATNPLAN